MEDERDKYLHEFRERLVCVIRRDDPAELVKLYHEEPDEVAYWGVWFSAQRGAKKCLTALVSGEVCEPPPPPPPPAAEGCATRIHDVSWYFPDLDVIRIMLLRGGVMDLNTKCDGGHGYGTPLQVLLDALRPLHKPLRPWSSGDSIFKLIILLCQWETKHRLDVARKFVPETDSINDLAWTFLRDGKLMQLAALLLVAREEVMVPLETTGRTIRQATMDLMETLNLEEGVDHERDQYKALLMDACKPLDVFERAGDALNSYSKMMCRRIPVDKVLLDVATILKKAGFSLQVADVDLRDCYRWLPELWNEELFNLLGITPGSKHSSLTFPTATLGSEPLRTILFRHHDPILSMFKSGGVLKLSSSVPQPRLLSTTARHMDPICVRSSIPVKHLACVAMKLKRVIRYL